MRPNLLVLEGFKGISKGLNRNRIEISFDDLPLGLIAIVGPNGVGKTTIMDNMHPFRIMPSRIEKDKLSIHSFSFFDHLLPGKAKKEFIWTQPSGRVFRADLSFNVKSKTGEYFLFEQIDGNWIRYKSDDGTIMSDGKSTSYDQCVEDILGSPELFFSCRFLAQNRKSLSSYGNTEMKALMAEMLNIDYMKTLSTKANEVAAILSKELDRRQIELSKMGEIRSSLGVLNSQLQSLPHSIETLRSKKSSANAEHDSLVAQLSRLNEQLSTNAKSLVRVKELQAKRDNVIQARDASCKQFSRDMQSRKESITSMEKQILNFRDQLRLKDDVLHAMSEKDLQAKLIVDAEESITKLSVQWEAANTKRIEFVKAESAVETSMKDGIANRSELERLDEQKRLAKEVPCASLDINMKCPLLANAHASAREFEVKFVKRNEIKERYRDLVKQKEQLRIEVQDFDALKQALDLARSQLNLLKEKHGKVLVLASKHAQIVETERSLVASEELLASIKGQLEETQAHSITSTATFDSDLRQIEQELAGLKSLDLSKDISDVQRKIEIQKTAIVQLDGAIEGEVRTQSRISTEAAHLSTQLSSERFLEHCVSLLSAEISHWKQLNAALGNNGLIALCIDDAGPALSNLANQLLACYGSQYTIEILTQIALDKGGVKEGFEIIAHESTSSDATSLSYMCGGEKVWINDCLCRAMSLYLGQRSSNTCMTLFSDETDGALDINHKRHFMKMKRMVLELSGCEREFFISHTPECVDYADAIIDVVSLV